MTLEALLTQNILAQARHKQITGQLTEALLLLSEALQKNPHDRDLLHARAHAFITLNNIPQAEKDLDTILSFRPNDAQAWDDRGVLYQRQNSYIKAAECHMKAANLTPTDGILMNLGIAMDHLGQKAQAEKMYTAVLQINPAHTGALTNMAVLFEQRGNNAQAEHYLQLSEKHGDASFEFFMTKANVMRKSERKIEALLAYEQALKLRPDNGPAAFQISILKGENPEAPPPEHVAGLFDGYADTFEASLVGQLKYRTPELFDEAAKKELQALKKRNAQAVSMDLGAGTGLFGKILRPYVHDSVGLDLSQKMLDKAQEQQIYDSVLCMDMIDGLKRYPAGHFDVIAAADVFVYVGKMDALFETIAASTAPDGLLIFSTEALAANESGDYVARETGRYAHNEDYLKKLIAAGGFETVHFERTWIRYNKNEPLDGFIVVAKKTN